MIKIAPSILSADFSALAEEVHKVEAAGADLLHIDIMDGHFVPNITFGPPVIHRLRKTTKLPFDVHLMIENPEGFIDAFVEAGADIITVHVETAPHLHLIIQKIKQHGIKAGVVLNPATPLSSIEEILPDIDMVLLMSVNPGFGGQKFIPSTLQKIKRLRQMITEKNLAVDIEVDGGVNSETSKKVIAAGANVLVAGSAVYGASDIKQAILKLRG